MSASITHSTVVVVADDGTSPVGSDEWNAAHTLSNVAATDGTLAQFAATTSLELKGVISDETGSGALVFANTPALVTPLLGTPTSGVLTNCTGTASGLTAGTVTTNANLTGDVTSSGNATTLATVNGNVGSFTAANITVNAKGLVTAAANGSAGSGITIGTSTITSGTAGRVLYETAGNVVGEISGATSNGTALTLVAPVLGTPASGTLTSCTGLPAAGVVGTAAILGANTFTALQTITQAAANTAVVAASGLSLTGSNATTGYSFSGTYNTSGVPTLFAVNLTNTASGANSVLFDFKVDTNSVLKYLVDSDVLAFGTKTAGASFSGTAYFGYRAQAGTQGILFGAAGSDIAYVAGTGIEVATNSFIGFNPSTFGGAFPDACFNRNAAGIIEVNDGTAGQFADLKLRQLRPDFTNTSTVGAVTINKSCGKAIIASGASSVVVTNSLVTANSQVLCTIASDDTTAILKNAVPASGSFTIKTTATVTSDCKVSFLVLNQ